MHTRRLQGYTSTPDDCRALLGALYRQVTTNFVLSRIEHDHPLSVIDLTDVAYLELTALNLLLDIACLEVLVNMDKVDLISQ